MRVPNLLATPRGRLIAFFLLYVAEGIPSGFTGTAIATQMRRQGLEPSVIGAFIGALYLPWAFKWVFGPLVDVISVERWGRRRTLALFIFGTTLPTLALAIAMQRFGWIFPIAPDAPGRLTPSPELVSFFRWMALAYAAFQGLMYGVGTAIFMDVTTRRVAATQFTAYMAMTNLVYSYSAVWQGHAVERWGYPVTLALD